MDQKAVDIFRSLYKKIGISAPDLHIVLGSGLGSAIDESVPKQEWDEMGSLRFSDVPGLHTTTVQGHAGVYRYFKHKKTGRTACFQVGRVHGYEGHDPREVVLTVMLPRLAGTKHFILTNAAGGLHKEYEIGSVMLMKDHVNLTGKNPLVGENPEFNGKALGPRFNDMSRGYDRAMTSVMREEFAARKFQVNEGVYIGLLGPSFETPAEIAMFARWGMDAVGMSTVWESIALNHSGAHVGGLSFISNLGSGLTDAPLNHESVLEATSKSASKVVEALFGVAAHGLSA